MPTRRNPAALLGPLIALILIGGITTAVLRGPGGDDNELAQQPTLEPTLEPTPEPTAEPTAPSDDVDLGTDPGTDPDTGTAGTASPTAAPAPDDDLGDEPAEEVDPNVTGGWTGGTPNTGSTLSAMGLALLVIGGGLLWLRRSRA